MAARLSRALIGNDLRAYDVRDVIPDVAAYPSRDAAQVQHITIHHDAVPFIGRTIAAELARIRATHHWHTQVHGWPGIGYHFYAFPSGRVYYVGDWATVRFHAAGPDDPATPAVVSVHNERGIAIVLAGNFDARRPARKMLAAVGHAVANVQFMFGGFLPVIGHRDHEPDRYPTRCPGGTWPRWKDAVMVKDPHPIPLP